MPTIFINKLLSEKEGVMVVIFHRNNDICKRSLFLFLVCVLYVLLSLHAVSAIAIGVNRATLEYEDVLRGGYAESNFIVSTDASQDIRGYVEVEGPVAEWLRFIPANVTTDGFIFSANKQMKIVVIVEPPADAANGDYEGTVRVITGEIAYSSSGDYGTSTRAAFKLKSLIAVTGIEKRACIIGGVRILPTEVNQDSDIHYTVQNTGNVRVQPDVVVEIFDQSHDKLVDRIVFRSATELLPTTTNSFITTLQHSLDVGQYWASVSSPDCAGSADVTFDVLERGGVADQGEFVRLESPNWGAVGEIMPIVAVFRNNGARTVSAKFKGTILLGKKLVKVIDTDFYEVLPGQTVDIESFFNPSEPGQFELKGLILYNNKVTHERTNYLNVQGEALRGAFNWSYVIIICLVLLLLFILIKKRRRRY